MSVFDLRGDWQLHQSNATVFLHIDQVFPQHEFAEAEPLKGRAQAVLEGGGGSLLSTDLTGTTRGNELFLAITWNQGSVGEYHGTFNFLGRLSGVTFDRNHPANQATWFADREFRRF
jgi:hypothetical protein